MENAFVFIVPHLEVLLATSELLLNHWQVILL
jgi:hypothetical protein